MKIELNCASCGGNRFAFPFNLRDDSMIDCAECGHEIGSLADLQKKVIAELAKRTAKE